MKAWVPAVVGLLFLLACLWGARVYVEKQLTDNLTAEIVAFGFTATSPTSGLVEVKVEVRNPTKLKGTFERLDGTLSVADRTYDWSLDGLQPGDRIAGGETRSVTVAVPLTLGDVLGTAATGLLTGKVDASFHGALVASSFGVEVEVPVSQERRLSLWRR